MRTYILRTQGTGWAVVDGRDGHTVGLFTSKAAAQAYLLSLGLSHTDNTAGESRAEVWS